MFYNQTRLKLPCLKCKGITWHERKEDFECYAVICLRCKSQEMYEKKEVAHGAR